MGTLWSGVELAYFQQMLVTVCDDPLVLGWGLGYEPYSNTTAGAKDDSGLPDLGALNIGTRTSVLQEVRVRSIKRG
ncbi:glycoside hydrolase, partial [Pseudomonas syringae pv. tagetis]